MSKYYKERSSFRIVYAGMGLIRLYKPKGLCCLVNPMTDEISNCGDETKFRRIISESDTLLESAKDFAKSLDVYKQGKYKIKEEEGKE